MSRTEEIAAQTGIRRQLLANGYTPLANKDKMCILPGWSHLPVDEAQIEAWSNQLKWRATGVRVEGGLVVIDLDVNDADAIDAIIEALPEEIWSILSDAPVRRGKGAKEAWFVRLAVDEVPFYRLASAGFRQFPGDETVHRVEIFADAGGGRQFGVYGAHSLAEDGSVAVEYKWAGDRGLLTVPLADLPQMTRAQLAEVAETASRVLEGLGWQYDAKSKSGFSSNAPIYDLDDQVFETRDHGEVDLNDLEILCASGDVRLSASWLEGESAVNMTRCIASLNPRDGRLSILETAAFEVHRPKDLAPKPITRNALERLQELTAASTLFAATASGTTAATAQNTQDAAQAGAEMADGMGEVVEALLHDVAYCPSEQRCVMPIDGGPERAMSLANFRVLMQPWSVEVAGPRGGRQVINPATLWAADSRRVVVGGHRFRPDLGGRLFTEDGEAFINTYRAPDDGTPSADVVADVGRAFEMLLEHLVPDPEARGWFRMWLASKIQRPHAPNCGVLLIAQQQGTGRGTLFDMMRAAVGRRYYRSISSVELLGGGGQGAYTEWASQALLVTVEEVMAGGDSGSNMGWKRREAYERIKQLVDPRQRVMEIRRKGLQNYTSEVFFSLLMATNHLDALPIDVRDRRIAVFMQPDVRFEDLPALKAAVDPWRAGGGFGDAFGAALRSHLQGVAVDFDALRIAPDIGGGREAMREANEGDLEDILRATLDRVPGDFMLNRDLRRRMEIAITADGDGDHLKNWWVRSQDTLRRDPSYSWRPMALRQKYRAADGRELRGTVYYRVGADLGAWRETSMEERAALLAVAGDVNARLSRAAEALRGGHLSVVETPGKEA